VAPEFTRTESNSRNTYFQSVGHFDWFYLKFVFWL
jgi:hypothetical protein